MARHLRVGYSGAIYHVTCRMIGDRRLEQSRLFMDDDDRKRFLDRLAERVEQFSIRLYQFVLMANHFHLVFETPEANCSEFMQSVLTAYTVYYNLRHGRHGHVFDGRFKAKLVEGDAYLLALTRYVHLNPVKVDRMKTKPMAEKVKYLREYRWSSYPSYIGKTKALSFIEYGPVLSEMGGKRRQWPQKYRQFVETDLAEDDEEFMDAIKASARCIGGDGFRAWVDGLYEKVAKGYQRKEDVSFRRTTVPLGSEAVMQIVAEVLGVDAGVFRERRRNSLLRAVAARCLMKYAACSQRDVAQLLGMGSGSAVSKQLSRKVRDGANDRKAAALLTKAEQRLDQAKQERVSDAAKS